MQAQRPGDILIVEADTGFAYSLAAALQGAGHSVVACTGGGEARWHLERTPFDVALCAWTLPDEAGASLCDFIKTTAATNSTCVALLVDPVHDGTAMMLAEGLASGEEAAALAARAGLSASLPSDVLVGPDEFIFKTISALEWPIRVQTLLRLRRYLEEVSNSITTLMAVAEGAEEQERRAKGHCRRLAVMSIELGAVMGCDEWQLTTLERAGYLHDIGKVGIPGSLLQKSAALSPREMEIIQEHCVYGEKLCWPVAALKPVLPIIRHHHERGNGTGYPDGLRANEIPILAQLFQIPDVYDALRTWRPYRSALAEKAAVDLIRQEVARGFWNRTLFEAFVEGVLPALDERLDAAHVLWPKG